MTRNGSKSKRLLLGLIFAGLNLLCFVGVSHGHHAARHTRVNYSHIPPRHTRPMGTRAGRANLIDTADGLVEHVAADATPSGSGPSGLTIGSPAGVAGLLLPAQTVSLLVRENVLVLDTAPRGPGLGRAPPTA